MTYMEQIIVIIICIGVIFAYVLMSARGLSKSRRSTYHASPASLRTARRALDHFGSYEAMERAAEKDGDDVHVLRTADKQARDG